MGLPFYIKANNGKIVKKIIKKLKFRKTIFVWFSEDIFGKDSSTDIYNFLHTENGKTEIYRFWTEYFMGIM